MRDGDFFRLGVCYSVRAGEVNGQLASNDASLELVFCNLTRAPWTWKSASVLATSHSTRDWQSVVNHDSEEGPLMRSDVVLFLDSWQKANVGTHILDHFQTQEPQSLNLNLTRLGGKKGF